MAEPSLKKMEAGATPPALGLDFGDDVQGIVWSGYGRLTDAVFLLLEIVEPEAARSWLRTAPVTTVVAAESRPSTALQVAFTRQGLESLGMEARTIAQFSHEFITGMAAEANRSRRLGDVGANAPSRWEWGGSQQSLPQLEQSTRHLVPHLVVMLYALPGALAAWQEAIKGEQWDAAFRLQKSLHTSPLDATEPFGFADGLSQPRLDWHRDLAVNRKELVEFDNLLALGEVVLGYPNEYGLYTQRPLLNPAADPRAAILLPAEDVPGRRDLGRNGSYLVLRQFHQDVRGFWQYIDRQAGGVPERRDALAAAMVGRTKEGAPLAPPASDPIAGIAKPAPGEIAHNQFTYAADPDGVRCPLGAHIRRANPRTADLPGGRQGWLSRLLRMLGFKRAGVRDDLVASTRFHRLLRRGRKYGEPLSPEEALQPGPANEPHGLHFACLVANISRQFEFVQNAWMASVKFDGFADESDPLVGNREPLPGCPVTDRFTIPQEGGPPQRITGMPQFVTVRGGAYFFLPGIRALRYIAGATGAAIPDPIEPAPGGSGLLLALHRAFVVGLHVERRLEPFFRRGFNRVFREPLAALIQYLINRRRPNEGLKLAEERIQPDEEASLDSIIASFAGYMQRTYRAGTFERGGNTKTHGIVRATVTIRDDLPAHMRHGIFATPRTFPAYARFSGPGPNLPRDIEDAGFISMAVKLMDVPGPKLMDDENHTQDLICVCTPTFVTPNTRENAKLQIWSFRDMPVFYFFNPLDSHWLDFFMQSLWNETQYNPLGHRYWSCVPYLLGEGQAMMYSFYPKSEVITDIPGVPFGRVPPNYLHDNMVATLARQDVEFDLLVQVQTDPHLMPIENAAVRWPEKVSPFIPAATIHIPRQKFDTPAHVALGKRLSLNPWHCLPEHRPLGNQSRARRRMYMELSRLRQSRNQTPHEEPTGNEVLD
jgi:deferrochelatase/peroxidase EfeB